MNGLDLLILLPCGNFLGALDSFLRLHGHLVKSQHRSLNIELRVQKGAGLNQPLILAG
jgi:hypothetical protein